MSTKRVSIKRRKVAKSDPLESGDAEALLPPPSERRCVKEGLAYVTGSGQRLQYHWLSLRNHWMNVWPDNDLQAFAESLDIPFDSIRRRVEFSPSLKQLQTNRDPVYRAIADRAKLALDVSAAQAVESVLAQALCNARASTNWVGNRLFAIDPADPNRVVVNAHLSSSVILKATRINKEAISTLSEIVRLCDELGFSLQTTTPVPEDDPKLSFVVTDRGDLHGEGDQ